MSYSISVHVKSRPLREKMYEFLQRNYHSWPDIVDSEEDPTFWGPYIDADLGSGQSLSHIGWEYKPGVGPEREYHHALVRWIALQVGKRRGRFRVEGNLSSPVPFIICNDLETIPVFFEDEWKWDKDRPLVNSLGLRVDESVARELAWLTIPSETFTSLSLRTHTLTSDELREILVERGLAGAYESLATIRSQLERLNALWLKGL